MKVKARHGKVVDLFAKRTCLACDLGMPHTTKQNEWCKVKDKKRKT